jgi:hypothetical protein
MAAPAQAFTPSGACGYYVNCNSSGADSDPNNTHQSSDAIQPINVPNSDDCAVLGLLPVGGGLACGIINALPGGSNALPGPPGVPNPEGGPAGAGDEDPESPSEGNGTYTYHGDQD